MSMPLRTAPAVGTLVTLPSHYHWSRKRVFRVVGPGEIPPSVEVIYVGDKRKNPKRYTVFPEECTKTLAAAMSKVRNR